MKSKNDKYKAKVFSFKYILFDILKWFAFWQCMLFYRVKKTYDGKQAKQRIKGGAIMASNHVSLSDPFVIQTAFLSRRFHFVYMKELLKNKFIKWNYDHVFLGIPIDRENPSFQSIKEMINYLKGGNLISIFPEGHICTAKDRVDEYKSGVVFMAYMARVEIIPIYHQKRKSIWNMTRIVVGKPFNVKEMIGPACTQDKINEVTKQLYDYECYLMSLLSKGERK